MLASSESGLQHALNGFAAACDIAGMKISNSKTEVIHVLRNPVQCFLQICGVSLKHAKKFKYLRIAFTSYGKQDEELDVRSGKAMRALHYSVVLKREAKFSVFKSIFVPIHIYRHESWVMTEIVNMLSSLLRVINFV